MPPSVTASIRAFSRFYTSWLGLLNGNLLGTELGLPAARVLFEVAQAPGVPAVRLAELLGMDGGQLSRVVRSLERRGLVSRRPHPKDGRLKTLRLTASGERQRAQLEARSDEQVDALLESVSDAGRRELAEALSHVRLVLGDLPRERARLRAHRAGDIGWIIKRHGELYASEYGWNTAFEALVARVAGAFLDDHDRARERCWIAEQAGRRAGSVMLTGSDTPDTCRLRLLLVEPSARGQGIGNQLVKRCLRFAREAGYRRITLWTNNALHAARRIYQGTGFTKIDEQPHERFGPRTIGETWARDLD